MNQKVKLSGQFCYDTVGTLRLAAAAAGALVILTSCSMSEEVRRIEQVRQLQQRRNLSNPTDLTGQQIFIRSCNTCHPGGEEGMGPALNHLAKLFPSDEALKKFLRSGSGMMPAQPKEVLNDRELESLVTYLRALNP